MLFPHFWKTEIQIPSCEPVVLTSAVISDLDPSVLRSRRCLEIKNALWRWPCGVDGGGWEQLGGSVAVFCVDAHASGLFVDLALFEGDDGDFGFETD